MMTVLVKTVRFTCFLLAQVFLLSSCSTTPEKPKLHTVVIEGMKFVPQEITVQKGDSVVWINRDMMAHDVTEELSKSWTSSSIPPGGSWKMEVTDNADYYCSIHFVMKGKLKVE